MQEPNSQVHENNNNHIVDTSQSFTKLAGVDKTSSQIYQPLQINDNVQLRLETSNPITAHPDCSSLSIV